MHPEYVLYIICKDEICLVFFRIVLILNTQMNVYTKLSLSPHYDRICDVNEGEASNKEAFQYLLHVLPNETFVVSCFDFPIILELSTASKFIAERNSQTTKSSWRRWDLGRFQRCFPPPDFCSTCVCSMQQLFN